MRDVLLTVVVGCVLVLVSFTVMAAVLDRDHGRADRAVRVLRLLLITTTSGAAATVVRLHAAGLL